MQVTTEKYNTYNKSIIIKFRSKCVRKIQQLLIIMFQFVLYKRDTKLNFSVSFVKYIFIVLMVVYLC